MSLSATFGTSPPTSLPICYEALAYLASPFDLLLLTYYGLPPLPQRALSFINVHTRSLIKGDGLQAYPSRCSSDVLLQLPGFHPEIPPPPSLNHTRQETRWSHLFRHVFQSPAIIVQVDLAFRKSPFRRHQVANQQRGRKRCQERKGDGISVGRAGER